MSSIGSASRSAYFSTHYSSSASSSSSTAASRTGTSHYMIYRNYKYYGLAKRVFHYSLILIRYYFHEPALRKLKQVQSYLLELVGFICLLILIPILAVSSLGKYFTSDFCPMLPFNNNNSQRHNNMIIYIVQIISSVICIEVCTCEID